MILVLKNTIIAEGRFIIAKQLDVASFAAENEIYKFLLRNFGLYASLWSEKRCPGFDIPAL